MKRRPDIQPLIRWMKSISMRQRAVRMEVRHPILPALCLIILTANITPPATGQGITDSIFSISEVAVTRSTMPLKEEAGMKRVTIDTLILQHQVHSDLSTLLAENTNIYIRDYGRGALATASFRGTAPSHTQVSWNGLSINSPMLGMVDFSLVPVFLIDELNIHHGAASVESRSGGLGGHIEIRNLPDWSNRAGGQIHTEYGSFITAGGMARFNLGNQRFQSTTRLYSSGSENNYPFVNKNIIDKDSATGELCHPTQQNRNAAYSKSGISQEFYFRPSKRSGSRRSSSVRSNAEDKDDPSGRITYTDHPTDVRSTSSPADPNDHPPTGKHSSPASSTTGYGATVQQPPLATTSSTTGTGSTVQQIPLASSTTGYGATGTSPDTKSTAHPPPGNSVISNRTWLQTANRSVPTVLSSEYQTGGLQRDNLQADQTIRNVTEYSYYGEQSKLQLRSGVDYQRLGYTMETEVPGLHRQINVDSESRMFSWLNSGELSRNFSDRLSANARTALNRYSIATYDSSTHTGYDTVRLEGSLFGGLYLSATELLMLSLQMRKDFVSDYRSPLIYTFGLNFRPLEKHDLVLQANFARNYHHPTLNDLYWQPGGNPDLLPEEGYTGESSVRWEKAAGGQTVNTSLTGYYSRINDWILWLPGFKGYWEPVNLAEVRSYGLEYQLAVKVTVRRTMLQLHGNFALTNTRDYSGTITGGGAGSAGETADGGTADGASSPDNNSRGVQLPFIPKVSGNAFVSVTNRGWYLQWQYNAMGTRQLMSGNSGGPADDSQELPGLNGVERLNGTSGNERLYSLYPYFMNNMRIGKRFEVGTGKNGAGRSPQKINLELEVDNLFNETYRNELQHFMPGRSYMLHLKFEY
ncbi:MAG: TonB-dependent receptor [Bacteroidales bacterium]